MSAATSPSAIPVMPLSALPPQLPLFPLSGVVLLPGARLPLNIFEPRYLAMVEHALGQPGRMVGIIQPSSGGEMPDDLVPSLYSIGCAGRITSFTETEDGRYLIGLTGICRFTLAEELPSSTLYRIARPDWGGFADDLQPADDADIDRKKLISVLESYFKTQGIAADWNAVQSTPNETLIASLVMICPLPPNEKQALLEAADLRARADLLTTLLEMASLPRVESEAGGIRH